MELSNRLAEIVKYVPENSSVADIGTDHGYIPVYLVQEKISTRVIASDVSPGSLDKTIEYVNRLGLNDKISPRLGDGLDVLKPNEVDTVIIAGMGGILISKILDSNKGITDTIDNFIFQPMVASNELRYYLVNNGYIIVDESLAKEGKKFYEIIVAKRGKDKVDRNCSYEIGWKLMEKGHPLLKEFIEYKKNEVEEILSKLGGKDSDSIRLRKEELLNLLHEYKEVAKGLEGN